MFQPLIERNPQAGTYDLSFAWQPMIASLNAARIKSITQESIRLLGLFRILMDSWLLIPKGLAICQPDNDWILGCDSTGNFVLFFEGQPAAGNFLNHTFMGSGR